MKKIKSKDVDISKRSYKKMTLQEKNWLDEVEMDWNKTISYENTSMRELPKEGLS